MPIRVVYCRILHRFLFEWDIEARTRWEDVRDGGNRQKQRFCFFMMDDAFTWVAGWDAEGRFIPGPYQKWYLDPNTGRMRRMKSVESSGVSRTSTIASEKA